MSIVASVYGRLAADPVERQTKTGKPMTTVSMAVDAAGKDAEPVTLWVGVLAFGAAAETLLRASKGQTATVMGRLTRGSYTTAAGETREQWSLLADSVLVAASARPSGRQRQERQSRGQDNQARYRASQRAQAPDLNDEIPF